MLLQEEIFHFDEELCLVETFKTVKTLEEKF